MGNNRAHANFPSACTASTESNPKSSAICVSGLVGVVINGLPNQMGGSQLLHAPRAVLWGQHTFGASSLSIGARVCSRRLPQLQLG